MQHLSRAWRLIACVLAFSLTLPLVVNPQVVLAAKSIKELEQGKKKLQGEINELDNELVELLSDISVMEGDIAENKAEIADAKVELKAAKEAEAKQYEDMKGRMKYMYENDQKSIFTLLLESGSIAEFLNQVDYANSVYEYDRQLLASYEATTEAVRDLKAALEEEQANLQAKESQLSAKKGNLNSMIAVKKTQMKDFDQQLAKARAEAARRAAEKARREAEARARANALAVSRQHQQEEERRRQQQQQQQLETASNDDDGDDDEEEVIESTDDYEDDYEEEEEEEEYGDPAPATSVSGSSVAGYASQFVGNPYKWGGNSLTSGCDCSGFVVQVYSHFGVNLSGSRSSGALRGVGKSVSYENIQPGDIVCYSGHVAIYAGGGRIVEAQSTKAGITSSRSVTCKPIVAIRRVV